MTIFKQPYLPAAVFSRARPSKRVAGAFIRGIFCCLALAGCVSYPPSSDPNAKAQHLEFTGQGLASPTVTLDIVGEGMRGPNDQAVNLVPCGPGCAHLLQERP
jgi:hypothetical protein